MLAKFPTPSVKIATKLNYNYISFFSPLSSLLAGHWSGPTRHQAGRSLSENLPIPNTTSVRVLLLWKNVNALFLKWLIDSSKDTNRDTFLLNMHSFRIANICIGKIFLMWDQRHFCTAIFKLIANTRQHRTETDWVPSLIWRHHAGHQQNCLTEPSVPFEGITPVLAWAQSCLSVETVNMLHS